MYQLRKSTKTKTFIILINRITFARKTKLSFVIGCPCTSSKCSESLNQHTTLHGSWKLSNINCHNHKWQIWKWNGREFLPTFYESDFRLETTYDSNSHSSTVELREYVSTRFYIKNLKILKPSEFKILLKSLIHHDNRSFGKEGHLKLFITIMIL